MKAILLKVVISKKKFTICCNMNGIKNIMNNNL